MFRGLRRRLQKYNNNRIEIILYHFVTRDDNPFSTSGHNVHPNEFEKQMRYLRNNYNVISLKDVINNSYLDSSNSKPWVSICFDDGYSLCWIYPSMGANVLLGRNCNY